MKQVKILIVGCGARGSGYGRFVLACPERAKVVAIAEPIAERRNAVGDAHNVPPEYRFNSWEDVARLPRLADAVLICTQDQMHEAPAIAFAQLGYDILLEKPMAPEASTSLSFLV